MVFFSESESVQGFLFGYIYIVVVDQLSGMGDTLIGLTLPYVCACPKQGPRFPTPYVVVFFMLNDLSCSFSCLKY